MALLEPWPWQPSSPAPEAGLSIIPGTRACASLQDRGLAGATSIPGQQAQEQRGPCPVSITNRVASGARWPVFKATSSSAQLMGLLWGEGEVVRVKGSGQGLTGDQDSITLALLPMGSTCLCPCQGPEASNLFTFLRPL